MDAFQALADPTRRDIVEILAAGEQGFGELADRFSISRPAVSQHLKILRDAGLVVSRADAQRRIYRLQENGLDPVDAWLSRVREYWNPRLDRLERVLSDNEGGEKDE